MSRSSLILKKDYITGPFNILNFHKYLSAITDSEIGYRNYYITKYSSYETIVYAISKRINHTMTDQDLKDILNSNVLKFTTILKREKLVEDLIPCINGQITDLDLLGRLYNFLSHNNFKSKFNFHNQVANRTLLHSIQIFIAKDIFSSFKTRKCPHSTYIKILRSTYNKYIFTDQQQQDLLSSEGIIKDIPATLVLTCVFGIDDPSNDVLSIEGDEDTSVFKAYLGYIVSFRKQKRLSMEIEIELTKKPEFKQVYVEYLTALRNPLEMEVTKPYKDRLVSIQ